MSQTVMELREEQNVPLAVHYYKANFNLACDCECDKESERFKYWGCECRDRQMTRYTFFDLDGEHTYDEICKLAAQQIHQETGGIPLDEIRVHWVKELPYLWMTVYKHDRAYGGPEEGGWYYDCGEPVLHVPLLKCLDVDAVRAELEQLFSNEGRPSVSSVLSRGQYRIDVDYEPGKAYPEETPHYE